MPDSVDRPAPDSTTTSPSPTRSASAWRVTPPWCTGYAVSRLCRLRIQAELAPDDRERPADQPELDTEFAHLAQRGDRFPVVFRVVRVGLVDDLSRDLV